MYIYQIYYIHTYIYIYKSQKIESAKHKAVNMADRDKEERQLKKMDIQRKKRADKCNLINKICLVNIVSYIKIFGRLRGSIDQICLVL